MEFVELVLRIEKDPTGEIEIEPYIRDASNDVSKELLNTRIKIESLEHLYNEWIEHPEKHVRKTARKVSDIIRIPGVFDDALNADGTEEQYRLPGATIRVYFESIELEFENEELYRRVLEEWNKTNLLGITLDDSRTIVINVEAYPNGGCIEYNLSQLREIEAFLEKIEELSTDYI